MHDLTGKKFRKLTAIRPTSERKWGLVVWECICDCGNITTAVSNHLVRESVGSCGCLKKIPGNILPEGEASFNSLLAKYQYHATNRNFEWRLSEEQFRTLTSSNCHYCGIEPTQKAQHGIRFNGYYIYNGIDRLDNSLGYTEENCVSCCGLCNKIKRTLTYEEFSNQVAAIYKHLKLGD